MKAPGPEAKQAVDGPGPAALLLNGTDGAAFKQTIRDFLLK